MRNLIHSTRNSRKQQIPWKRQPEPPTPATGPKAARPDAGRCDKSCDQYRKCAMLRAINCPYAPSCPAVYRVPLPVPIFRTHPVPTSPARSLTDSGLLPHSKHSNDDTLSRPILRSNHVPNRVLLRLIVYCSPHISISGAAPTPHLLCQPMSYKSLQFIGCDSVAYPKQLPIVPIC